MTATSIQTSVLVLAATFLACVPALAETKSFKAELKPVEGIKSTASGTVTATYDTDTKKLTWQGSYRGLGTYATAANVWGPGPGKRQRPVVRMRNIDSPFEGLAIVPEKQADDLLAGRWQVIIQTAGYPNGELAGALQPAN